MIATHGSRAGERAHVKNGRLVLDEPTTLPEGAEVRLWVVEGDDLDAEDRAELYGRWRSVVARESSSHRRSVHARVVARPRLAPDNPNLGTLYEAVRFEAPVRRILMPKTESHVYHVTIGDEVVIVAVWGARRRRGPKV